MSTVVDLPQAAEDIVATASAEGLMVRILGGVGVYLRCPSAKTAHLGRPYADIDLITLSRSGQRLSLILDRLGYEPAKRFNALHGLSRMLFDSAGGVHVDVLVDRFEMSHRLDLRHRLTIDPETVSLADLLLTKLQVGKYTDKDALDSLVLFIDHDLTNDDVGINLGRITDVVSKDWGWWRTATDNLRRLSELASSVDLDPRARAIAIERINRLTGAIEQAPKSLRWRLRDRIGERIEWRLDPEEIGR